jgi:hypothetical protein
LIQSTFHDEGRRLRALSTNASVRFAYTDHALSEMRKDQATKLDIEYALKRGAVVRVEWNREEVWNVRGSDADGRAFEIVVVAYETEIRIKLITAWAL